MSQFVHLRVHTEFSMVDGLLRTDEVVKACAGAGMAAVALTDQNNLCGLVKFYKAAQSAGVKPLIGADIWLKSERMGNELFRAVLLAQSNDGYKNLTRLISRAYTEGQQRGVPVIEQQWLFDANDGLIVLSGGREGDVGKLLLANQPALAAESLAAWKTHFPQRFYLEVQRTGRDGEESYLHKVVALADGSQTPVVATNDVRFLKADDFEAHEVRVCINQGRVLDDPRRPREYSAQQYLRTPAEMAELFSDLPEAIENTVEIAKRCNVTLQLGKYFLPEFPVPDGFTITDFFAHAAREGLQQRLNTVLTYVDTGEKRKQYADRLEIEIGVISKMGFEGYFLIVADFIKWGKSNGVPVGPGRGSGAGSLVAYSLGITDLDPLPYDLLFERFLNPERVSMPDFDVDFCMEGRDRVIDYVAQKYGRHAVSQIITFGTMAAKAVVRDVGRVMGQPYGMVDKIAKLIPLELEMTLDKAFAQEEELRKRYENEEDVRAIWDMALKLEGLTRNAGKHAGGVVIAPSDLTDFAPLYCDEAGQGLVVQFDKDDIEQAGLVKFDFLGLKTLTVVDWAVQMINERRARTGEAPVQIEHIPLTDSKVFELLKAANTGAVFQLESTGMRKLIAKLKPSRFEDIVALVALYRPGPLESGMVDDFIKRKHGEEPVAYPHPDYQHEWLKPVLEPTYGIILYQEQVMQIAQVLGGYSLGGADLLRRAMGKKKPEEMAKQREFFQDGAAKQGIDADLAAQIFDLMEKFAGYGFNKSHSAAYALVSYQTAWLKTHYPAEFFAATMSADMHNTDKVVGLIDDATGNGMRIVPPDVNHSQFKFTVGDARTVIYGIGAIRGVGENAVENIIVERETNGAYQHLFDFCARVDLRKVNRRVLEALINAGAMDKLGPSRAVMLASLDEAIKAAEQAGRDKQSGQNDLFGGGFGAASAVAEPLPPNWVQVHSTSEEDQLRLEKETLGLYLTGHPIDRYLGELKNFCSVRLSEVAPTRRGENVTVAGLLIGIRVMQNKSGARWAILTLDDKSGRLEAKIFSELYEKHKHQLVEDKVLVLEGEVYEDEYLGRPSMTVRGLLDIAEARARYARRLELGLNGSRLSPDRLISLLRDFGPGSFPVLAEYRNGEASVRVVLGDDCKVLPRDELLQRLKQLDGCERVEVVYH
ncbi:DNA polymerase III subunit alpha [Permianibacter sp. IMCC34836]|uniref:DNA polymerase III subunit alpha n=1 Tax=Permianibacter fluminis TaxID=2738515 RepID=UPI00155671C6|nr:DNA polymerase III subunit alpha [Permianibacter fluminis]NQD38693.1 DNA polymerase III subunit alpha [Permianibacter fluminis]